MLFLLQLAGPGYMELCTLQDARAYSVSSDRAEVTRGRKAESEDLDFGIDLLVNQGNL